LHAVGAENELYNKTRSYLLLLRYCAIRNLVFAPLISDCKPIATSDESKKQNTDATQPLNSCREEDIDAKPK
jgi:hypothetical protein